jgi:GGDEF domain-containing protein
VTFVLVQCGAHEAAVVQGLRRCLPAGTFVGRGEGGEITVVVRDTDAATTTEALEGCLPGCGPDVRAGVAEAPTHASTADELYMAADAALADAVDRGEPVVAAR